MNKDFKNRAFVLCLNKYAEWFAEHKFVFNSKLEAVRHLIPKGNKNIIQTVFGKLDEIHEVQVQELVWKRSVCCYKSKEIIYTLIMLYNNVSILKLKHLIN